MTALDAERIAFVQAFVEGWALGAGADRFCDHFLPRWVDPDVTLIQPTFPDARGHDGFRRFAHDVFELAPDLRADVLAARPTADGVELDLWFHGTIGGRATSWSGQDTIVLRDGRLLRREAEFDLGPVLGRAARSPQAVAGLARAAVPPAAVDRGLLALAVGRLTLGGLSRIAPGAAASAFGAGAARSPELDYVTRVFGIRAVALGLGYLGSGGTARRRWQRLAFVCDISDTIAGVGDLVRGRVPRPTALRATILTGSYAAVGAAAIWRDRRA